MKKRTIIQSAIAVVAVGSLATVGTVAFAEDADVELGETIDEILTDERLTDSQVGIVVADAESGDVLYENAGNTRGNPASQLKTLTSAAALGVLGPDYTFATDVLSSAKPSGGTLGGDLFLRGSGDPTMLAEDYDALAKSIADAGVTTVEGDLVADDTAYDSSRLGADWAIDDEPYYYAAQTSALTIAADEDYDAGSVVVTVAPGTGEGDEPKVSFGAPTEYLSVDNRATTIAAGGETSIGIDREHGSNTFVVTGEIAADDDGYSDFMSVWEPTGFAADVFRLALAENGVSVAGDVRLGEATPDDAEKLAGRDSMPLSDLMVPFMKLSNNSHAESLTKAMGLESGGEGSWDAGLTAVSDFVNGQGVKVDGVVLVDGSGLSRRNFISAEQFVNLFGELRDEAWFDTWYESLPIACQSESLEGGTLRSRMCDTPAAENVHGKTGSMSGVSTLGGYVTDADGRELIFSVVQNDLAADSATDIEDSVAVALASYSESKGLSVEEMPKIPQPEKTAPNGLECSWVKPIVC